MAELWVGAGKPFARVSDAVSAAGSGDTIFVQAGTYTNDFSTIYKDLKIVGVGGMAHFANTTMIPNGKAIFVVNGDVTFENVEFSGAKVWDWNGAGIRYESGDLIVRDSYFHDNQNGILAASNLAGTITIERSEFARNGVGDGQTHGVYVNEIGKLTVVDSSFHDTNVGHHLKSRADSTEVRNTTFDDGAQDSSYAIDLPNGGAATIVGNTLIQGANVGNKYMIHYGGEVPTPKPGAVLIEGNTFINYRSFGVGVYNDSPKSMDLKGNAFFGVNIDAEGGPIVRADNAVGVLGQAGANAVVGGAGLDKIDYRFSPGAVTVDLVAGVAADGYGSADTLSGVEQVGGSRFADVISGDGLANRLDGAEGNDRLSGAGGDDLLAGGRGDDVLDGGAGVDTAFYAGKAADYDVSLSGGEVVVEALNGGEGVDRLTGVEKLRFADGVVNAPAAPVNAAPVAGADQASTPRGQAVVIDVLANDADANGDALTVSALGAPLHGTAQLADGRVTYTPAAGYVGADSFTYQVSDGQGGFATASVAVTVTPVNDAPIANADQAITPQGQAVAIDVLANDGDADGDALFISRIVAAPGHGSAAAVDGKIVYTPAAGYSGADVFAYEASDGKGGRATASVSIAVQPPLIPPPAPAPGVNIVGGAASETLVGGALADAISGGGGADRLYGYGGADRLAGDDGDDWLYGGDGNDELSGGSGKDRLQADAGDDRLEGGAGDDLLFGGAGVDVAVFQGAAADYRVTRTASKVTVEALVGAEGKDTLYEVEQLRFADGTVDAQTGAAIGGAPPPPPPASNLAPLAANDAAVTQAGQSATIDVLANDSDPDGDVVSLARIVTGPAHGAAAIVDGKIVYTGAAGYVGADLLAYEASDGRGGVATASVSLTVEAPPPPPPDPDPVGVTLVGSGGKDILKGGTLADAIDGAGGNDVLYGYAGDDRLVGGDGADMIYGGDGADILLGGEGNDRLQGDAGDDTLDGGAGTDTLYGGDGDDTFIANVGGDKYYGGAGVDALIGGAGDDAILLTSFAPSNSIEIVDGKGGVNAIVGDALSNLLDFRGTGLVSIARIEGGAGNDRIYGSSGADVIFGGDGSDTLNGGGGADRLTGGSGGDLFVFERGCGADLVTDFRAGGQAGVIDLRDFDLSGFDALRALCSEAGGSVAIDLPGADSVTLQGWRLADLASGQFLL